MRQFKGKNVGASPPLSRVPVPFAGGPDRCKTRSIEEVSHGFLQCSEASTAPRTAHGWPAKNRGNASAPHGVLMTMRPTPQAEATSSALPSTTTTGSNASAFDRARWQKRLRRILDELPGSQPQWHDLMTDAHALQLEPDWIADRQREEFAFIIRRAVADKVFSEEDHHKLDLARKLIGMSEAEAEVALHAIMAEAEAFFGAPVKDDK